MTFLTGFETGVLSNTIKKELLNLEQKTNMKKSLLIISL